MSRFHQLFARLQQNQEKAFVPFVTLGDPNLSHCYDIIHALVEGGADALELGLPFSDPLLDGEIIQAANHRSLCSGTSIKQCFELIYRIREHYPTLPISLLLCANLIHAQTLDGFYHQCQQAGVDAVLVADVPIFAAEPFIYHAKKYGIQPVFICPPNANNDTLAQIAKHSEGYIYLVSRQGVTSADNQSQSAALPELIAKLKAHKSAPILQGFGIATPEQVKTIKNTDIDGVISGSATVSIIANHLDNSEQCLYALKAFVKTMKAQTYSK